MFYWIVICAGIGGILYGYDIGVISGALLFVKKSIPMSNDQMGFIVGAVLGGGLFGTLVSGPLTDRFGRRSIILLACIIFYLGVFAILQADSFYFLLSARLLLGVGVGIISVTVPLYLTEVAPAHLRGRSVTVFQLFLTFGILLAYLIDLLLTPSGNWRGMFAVILVPTTILLIGMYFLPETPRWLISKNRLAQAKLVLQRIHPDKDSDKAITAIANSLKHEDSSWLQLCDPIRHV